MVCILFAVFYLLTVGGTVAQICNPVININTECDVDDDVGNSTVTVSTELQTEQTQQLFKNVSEQLLDEYEKRFKAFVSTLNVTKKPIDCQDVYDQGSTETGIYMIYPHGTSGFPVRCDMDSGSGGWTVFQRRISDSDFYKTWVEYKYGFGNLSTNFWLGNQQIHKLTTQGWYELRIDMVHPDGRTAYAEYQMFSIGDLDSKYRLSVYDYSGTAGDSLLHHNGCRFSTKDSDNDSHGGNCATQYHGAWWYKYCHLSNLNGDYGNSATAKGLTWYSFTGNNKSLNQSEMKVRRWVSHADTTCTSVSVGT